MSQFRIRETINRMMAYNNDTAVKCVRWQLAELINQEEPGFFQEEKYSL